MGEIRIKSAHRHANGGRILAADDSAAHLRIIVAILEGLGWSVRAVANGEAALAACARERFEAIVLDRAMPGIGGIEAARRLRALGVGATPIVLLSSSLSPAIVREAYASGIDVCLAKPARPAQIADALARALALRAGRRSA